MQITLDVPEDIARHLETGGPDASRVALEGLAVEGYRSGRLSESQLRRLLQFATRCEVHGFLKEHGVPLHYSEQDLEHDRERSKVQRRMVVIADTSPLNYLILIGQADLLPQLYGQIAIPRAVLLELQDPKAPASVARWMAYRPRWLVVKRGIAGRAGFRSLNIIGGTLWRYPFRQPISVPKAR